MFSPKSMSNLGRLTVVTWEAPLGTEKTQSSSR
jgi:hypothetical protein